jgi:hypothetical protein
MPSSVDAPAVLDRLLLPGHDDERAAAVVERARATVARDTLAIGVGVTISAGVCSLASASDADS